MSSNFKHIIVLILALLLFIGEVFSLTLYTAGSSVEDAMLTEINENMDLDALADKYAPKSEYTDFDVISTIKFLSRLVGLDILDGIETTDDFVKALLKTDAMTQYMQSFSAELVDELKKGNTTVEIDSAELSEAVVSGITQLFGVSIAENSQVRQFAESVAEDYINNMISGKDSEDMLEEFGVSQDSLDTLRMLTSEKARRISVAVCASIAVLMFVLCGKIGVFLFSAGIPTAISGAGFLVLGVFSQRFADIFAGGPNSYISSLITAMKPLSEKYGGIVFAVGAAFLVISGFLPKRNSRDN